MKYLYLLLLLSIPFWVAAQNVGIGTTSPLSRLHVEQGNVLLIGPAVLPSVAGALPVSGAGNRLMWYADKAAFRVGGISGNSWDKDSVGNYSIAAGYDTKAIGIGTVALGYQTIASGENAVAIGYDNKISGYHSAALGAGNNVSGVAAVALGVSNQADNEFTCAIGYNNISNAGNALTLGKANLASANSAAAIGFFNKATEFGSFAIGAFNISSGYNSYAIGTSNAASATNSIAIGNQLNASGDHSMALGNSVSTSGYSGAFALGDNSTTILMQSFVANGFRARFAGGYRLFTNSAVTIGAFLNAGANSWAALSDKRMKENFLPVDGESFLKHIAAMPLTTWNYKGQDIKTMRHYGPMAQDFYAAFGKDALGEIGCDTLINQQDFLGVNLIAIQALGKRTEKINELEKKMDNLEKENAWLKEQLNTVLKAIKKAE